MVQLLAGFLLRFPVQCVVQRCDMEEWKQQEMWALTTWPVQQCPNRMLWISEPTTLDGLSQPASKTFVFLGTVLIRKTKALAICSNVTYERPVFMLFLTGRVTSCLCNKPFKINRCRSENTHNVWNFVVTVICNGLWRHWQMILSFRSHKSNPSSPEKWTCRSSVLAASNSLILCLLLSGSLEEL